MRKQFNTNRHTSLLTAEIWLKMTMRVKVTRFNLPWCGETFPPASPRWQMETLCISLPTDSGSSWNSKKPTPGSWLNSETSKPRQFGRGSEGTNPNRDPHHPQLKRNILKMQQSNNNTLPHAQKPQWLKKESSGWR